MRLMPCFVPLAFIVLTMAQGGAQTPEPQTKGSDSKAPATTAHKKEEGEAPKLKKAAAVSAIEPEDLADFDSYAPQVQQLIRRALALTKRNLTYTFGSSDPGLGGMDCSGTISHLLQGLGIKGVPRQSDQMADWVAEQTLLHRPEKDKKVSDPAFAALNPGDLLFWTGTYDTAPRKNRVSHVMLYLGKLKKTGKPVLFGASDGRAYEGQRRTGVSVFDFTLPKAESASAFYGYGLIPGLGRVQVETPAPPPPEPKEIAASDTASEEKELVTQQPPIKKEEVRKALASKAPPPATSAKQTKGKTKAKASSKKK